MLLCDDKFDIFWLNFWDLFGGGRDGDEDLIEIVMCEL